VARGIALKGEGKESSPSIYVEETMTTPIISFTTMGKMASTMELELRKFYTSFHTRKENFGRLQDPWLLEAYPWLVELDHQRSSGYHGLPRGD
jgi:hypothetical protein